MDGNKKKVFFPFIHLDRIGEIIDQMFCLRNLYPVDEYEVTVITYDQSIMKVINEATFDIAVRGMKVIYTKDAALVGSHYSNPAENRIIIKDDSIYVILIHTQLKAKHREKFLNRQPHSFFKLSREDEAEGSLLRSRFGIPEDAKTVCLYVRDGACFGQDDASTYRNSDIRNFFPALRHLLDLGYFIVRIGDRRMAPLEIQDNRIIDAPFHPACTSLVEPYFIAKADFVLGTSSGPMGLAPCFDKPVVYVDSIIDSGYQIWINRHTIHLFKKYFSNPLGRFLTYEEVMQSVAVDFFRRRLFEEGGITLVDDSPEEILAATKEMIARISGTWPETAFTRKTDATVRRLHEKADYLRQHYVTKDTIPFFPFYSLHRQYSHISHEYVRMNPWFLGHDWPVVKSWGWEPELELN